MWAGEGMCGAPVHSFYLKKRGDGGAEPQGLLPGTALATPISRLLKCYRACLCAKSISFKEPDLARLWFDGSMRVGWRITRCSIVHNWHESVPK